MKIGATLLENGATFSVKIQLFYGVLNVIKICKEVDSFKKLQNLCQ